MSISSTPMKSVSVAYRENQQKEEEKDTPKSCYCWPFCPKPKNPSHERGFTQHELDYIKIMRIESAKKEALKNEEKK